MISIKVCKLSDLTNKALFILISSIGLLIIYNIIMNFINEFSVDFIKFSIDRNLCIEKNDNILEKLIYLNLPINNFNYRDDIENEFNLADNNIGKFFEETDNVEDNSLQERINESKNFNQLINNEKFAVPYLLKYEQLSDGKYKIGDVIINDYTKKKLDFSELEKSLFTEIEDECKVLIYHTHTSESYAGVQNYSDSYRTEDNNSNVVKVGKTLKEELNKYGIFARHDTTTHDYPSYNGAYKSSLKTVESILKKENYDIIIDVHRDALASNSQYRPTAEINGETCAKLMFVIGTNAAGLKHDNWIENLKFAIAVQQRAEEMYPGLFRDLHLSTSRYNQHTSNKSIILEVGATGNTIDEACLAMKYLASVLNAMKT